MAKMQTTRFGIAATVVLVVAIGAALTGCATTPGGAGEGVQLLTAARAWQDSLAEERFGRALRLVSHDFSSRAWPDKDALSDYFDVAEARGFFLNAAVEEGEVRITLEDGVARIYPVGIRANLGLAVFELSFRKEKSTWKITSLEMELY